MPDIAHASGLNILSHQLSEEMSEDIAEASQVWVQVCCCSDVYRSRLHEGTNPAKCSRHVHASTSSPMLWR